MLDGTDEGTKRFHPLSRRATLRALRFPDSALRALVGYVSTELQSFSQMQVLFLAIGVVAGLLSGVFGIGGGILIVPALLFFASMTPASATGTSLGALLLPVGALGAWQYYKSGHVNVTASLLIALGLFLGAYFGARIGLSLSPTTTKRAFAVFLVLVSARIWFTA